MMRATKLQLDIDEASIWSKLPRMAALVWLLRKYRATRTELKWVIDQRDLSIVCLRRKGA